MFDRLKGPTRLANGTDLAYGFGLGEERHRGLRGWGHGGATGTHWAFYPEIDLIVAVFTNHLGRLSAGALHTQMVDAFLASDLGSGPFSARRDRPGPPLSRATAGPGRHVRRPRNRRLPALEGPARVAHASVLGCPRPAAGHG